MIEKTEKRLDQLNYLLGDINMKIQSLNKEQKAVEDVSAQLSAISVQSLEAKNMMIRLSEEKLVLIQEENKIVSMRKELEELLVSVRQNIDGFENNVASMQQSRAGT
jgi:uncharacterized protein YoxC